MKTMAFGCVCALLLSGCATERYGVSVTGTRNDWVAVRIDRVTGEACYTDTPWCTWTPIREKGKTGEKPNTAALAEPSRHKAEMAKMTDEQLKTHLRDLREKYHSAVQQREQPRYVSPRMLLGPTYNIEAQAALERAEEEASSRHKAEMAKMTDEQLKTHLRDLREKYRSAGQQREQANDALSKTSRGPFEGSMPTWKTETDQAIRYIEAQAALECATKEENAIKPTLNEAASAYKERLLSQFKASQHLPAN